MYCFSVSANELSVQNLGLYRSKIFTDGSGGENTTPAQSKGEHNTTPAQVRFINK